MNEERGKASSLAHTYGTDIERAGRFSLVTLFRGGFLSVAYITVANLAQLGISVHC